MIKIRPATLGDFEVIVNLLTNCDVEAPVEPADMAGGVCLIADDGTEVVGCLYCMHGGGTTAYGDYYTAKTTKSAFLLWQHMETVLRLRGVKRLTFNVEKHNTAFSDMAIKCGCKKLRDLDYYRREL